MTSSAVEAEATGQEYVTALFKGRDWLIPLDVDAWPVDAVLASVAVVDNTLTVNHFALTATLQALLGDQWARFAADTRRGDLVAASHKFAEAVGIPKQVGQPLDIVFGAIPRLLLDLRRHEAAIEATLRGEGLDYRDRYRFDQGRRCLTLRQISNALRYAPYDCPLNIEKLGRRPLTDAAMVLMDIFEHGTGVGVPHPDRPLPPGEQQKRQSEAEKRRKAHEDYRKRHAKKSTAAETARANAEQAQRKVAHA